MSHYESGKAVLLAWIHRVGARQVEEVLGLYAADAVLQPTFSSRMLRDDESRRCYFTQLSEREGLEVLLHEKTLRVQPLGEGQEVLCGLYLFSYVVDGELLKFEARFTMVTDLRRERPIVHHHSSQVPRTLT